MPSQNQYQYRLNNQLVNCSDPILSGREIRSSAGLNPASDYVLIELLDRHSRSIGLEEKLDLSETDTPELLWFKSDRVYSYTVNERGFEWGASKISVQDIRKYASIPDTEDLIFDSKKDKVLELDQEINLNRKGVERFSSREPEQICIYINTRPTLIERGKVAFKALVGLAFPDMQDGPNTSYTVSYRKGHGETPEGTIIEGEFVRVKKGMIFNVTATDKS
ncbi:multiubiquitin domain-containing protein [Kordiimonas sp. SCSIO 12603]|uniref:multiubiquitin domain-containing protein n=1 Tax=Kordiimonas sp. SCSIO 12603 TaxID=2829596 RepID=UPI002104009F|nr:multiubiquitin domain-containing protein [Kordiimonas sp. SCSIO 12603]UTW59044.1 multiubiquitin domain-containing protein [Kordiimonas sp. SCSIO 12603]